MFGWDLVGVFKGFARQWCTDQRRAEEVTWRAQKRIACHRHTQKREGLSLGFPFFFSVLRCGVAWCAGVVVLVVLVLFGWWWCCCCWCGGVVAGVVVLLVVVVFFGWLGFFGASRAQVPTSSSTSSTRGPLAWCCCWCWWCWCCLVGVGVVWLVVVLLLLVWWCCCWCGGAVGGGCVFWLG